MAEALVHIDGFKMEFGDKTVIRDLSFARARRDIRVPGHQRVGEDRNDCQEAGTLMGVIIALIFVLDLRRVPDLLQPVSPIVQFIYVPPVRGPVTAMIRNGLCSLSLLETAIVLASLDVWAVLMLLLAVRPFPYASTSSHLRGQDQDSPGQRPQVDGVRRDRCRLSRLRLRQGMMA